MIAADADSFFQSHHDLSFTKKVLRAEALSRRVLSLSGSLEFPLTQRMACPADVSHSSLE
jgi:hypothetical protein